MSSSVVLHRCARISTNRAPATTSLTTARPRGALSMAASESADAGVCIHCQAIESPEKASMARASFDETNIARMATVTVPGERKSDRTPRGLATSGTTSPARTTSETLT
eukprot:Amastigsp_a842552_9.p8 type:complete len:109 gc:universal Amastigsp_a842552_9:1352-1678(+)